MTDAAPAPTARRGVVLVGLVLTMALAAMDTTIVSTAVPQIVGSIGGFSVFSWLFSVYLLTQTVTIPVYGKLADLYGRKPVLLGGIAVFLVGSAACSEAWSMVALIDGAALDHLRFALDAATHHLYAALTVVGVLAVAALLLAPRRFPVSGESPGAG